MNYLLNGSDFISRSIILCSIIVGLQLVVYPCGAEQSRLSTLKSVETELLDIPEWFGYGVSNQNFEQFISTPAAANLSGTWEGNVAACLRANPDGKPEEDRGTYVCHGYDTSWGKASEKTCRKLDNGSFECTSTYPDVGDQVCSVSQSTPGELNCCNDHMKSCRDRYKECFYNRDHNGRPTGAICNFFPNADEKSKRCEYRFGDDGAIVEEICEGTLTNGRTSSCVAKYDKGLVVSRLCIFWDLDGKIYSICSIDPIKKLEKCDYVKDDNIHYSKECPDGSKVTVRVRKSQAIESCAQPKGKPKICYLPTLDISCREPDKDESRIICHDSKSPERCFVIDKSTGNMTDIDQSLCDIHRRYLKAQLVKITLEELLKQPSIDEICKDIGAMNQP